MSHGLSIVFSRPEPVGQWPWSNCIASVYEGIPSASTSCSILLKLSVPFEMSYGCGLNTAQYLRKADLLKIVVPILRYSTEQFIKKFESIFI